MTLWVPRPWRTTPAIGSVSRASWARRALGARGVSSAQKPTLSWLAEMSYIDDFFHEKPKARALRAPGMQPSQELNRERK